MYKSDKTRIWMVLFVKCCSEDVIKKGKMSQKGLCMGCDYDHPSERRKHMLGLQYKRKKFEKRTHQYSLSYVS